MTLSLNQFRSDSNLQKWISRQFQAWPDHGKFLEKSFSGRSTEVIESSYLIADLVDRLVSPDYQQFTDDYRWLCGAMFEEEIYFQRFGEYLCKTLAEAKAVCYDNPVIIHIDLLFGYVQFHTFNMPGRHQTQQLPVQFFASHGTSS